MATKSILVPIPDAAASTAASEIAWMMARAVAGHVGTRRRATPAPRRQRNSLRRPEYARTAQARERAAEQVRAEFQGVCAAHGVLVCGPDASGPVPSASWRQVQGSHPSAVTARPPAYDVMVVPNQSKTTPAREIAEHALLETGRPVLLLSARPGRIRAARR